MKLIIRTGIFSTLMLVFLVSVAQIPQKAMEIPAKYITPEEGVSLNADNNTRPGSFWIVFSDKQGNETFENSSGRKIKRTVNFMDAFYVVEDINDRVHIIKDANYKVQEGFSSSAEDYGWIEKENLLLWDHCLITPVGKIYEKGMVLNTIESIKHNKIKKGDEDYVRYYFDPQLTKESGRSSKIYKILYVYKITDEAILLGKNYVTDVFHAKEEIFGWVSNKKITIWDNRIAVEPNWDKEAAQERKQKNISATFYVDIASAKLAIEGNKVSDKYIVWSHDTYENRNIGDWMRFPLLSYNKETGIIKAGVFANIQNTEVGLYFPAYSSLYIEGLNHPLYKLVLMMSLRELGNLLNSFDELADACTSSSQRQRLKEVWLEILQSHLGDDFSREQAENMTFEKINEKVFGLPGTSTLLHILLADITDPSVVSDAKFYEYASNIKMKRIELYEIYSNSNFEYRFNSYNTQYFWISQDLLP